MGSYPIGVVGESFANDDGSSRQAEIALCTPGEPVSLKRDPNNKFDSNCVKVLSARGVQIGNISRDDGWVCERMDREGFVQARILRVGKGAKGQLGVVLCIRTVEDDEWLEDGDETASRKRKSANPGTGCSLTILAASLVPGSAYIWFG